MWALCTRAIFSLIRAATKPDCSPVVVSYYLRQSQTIRPLRGFPEISALVRSRPGGALENLGVDYLIRAHARGNVPARFSHGVRCVRTQRQARRPLATPAIFTASPTDGVEAFRNRSGPASAYFGRKERKQARIIRQMSLRPQSGRSNRRPPDSSRI